MKSWQHLFPLFLFLCLTACQTTTTEVPANNRNRLEEKYAPSEDFFLQRSFPENSFNIDNYTKGLASIKNRARSRNGNPLFEQQWATEGPGNLGSRINTVTYHPEDTDIILAGFASGGIFKTTDGGASWRPVFDDQLFLAIGAITFDPLQPHIVYAGTGDPNISGFPFLGDGLYKSMDTGETWTYIGLKETRIISRILVHPTNSDILYVSTMGLPFKPNTDKGLYKSNDAGETWEQVLFMGEETGAIDVVLDTENPDIIFVAGWDRLRNSKFSQTDGAGAKIHRSKNGGQTWEVLSHILPQGNQGRIGLATSQGAVFSVYIDPNHNLENIYRSYDKGTTWEIVPTNESVANAVSGFGWYFGQIRVNPQDQKDIFLLGVTSYRSRNAGFNWEVLTQFGSIGVHVDHHDLVVHPSGKMLLATDGGLYESQDKGRNWRDIENIPASQTYRVAANPHQPTMYYGGFQDNGSAAGNSTSLNAWQKYRGSDGFLTVFHPTDPLTFYAEKQRGWIEVTTDGGDSWRSFTSGINNNDRIGWDAPYIMSPHNPNVLYFGSDRLYETKTGPSANWSAISNDLTDGEIYERPQSISAISQSALNKNYLYVGTMDANVWRSLDEGLTWEAIHSSLPERAVTDVQASSDSENTLFVSFSGYKDDDHSPRIYRSDNNGDTWQSISGNLPDLAINAVEVPQGYNDQIIFVATDGGVYGTLDGGETWDRLGINMPIIAIYDLAWNTGLNTLVAGSFARSILSYPLEGFVEPSNNTLSSVKDLTEKNTNLSLYPNPVFNLLHLEFANSQANEILTFVVFDINGKEMFRFKELVGKEVAIHKEVSMLTAGTYILQILGEDSFRSTRFIKTQ